MPATQVTTQSLPLARWSRMRVFRRESSSGYRFDLHRHAVHEIVLVVEGRGEAHVASEVLPYGPGDIIAIDDDVAHTFVTAPSGTAVAIVVQYGDDALSGVGAAFSCPPKVHGLAGLVFETPAVGSPVSALFDRCLAQWRQDEKPEDGLRSRAVLFELLAELYALEPRVTVGHPATDQVSTEGRKQIARLLEHIEANHSEQLRLGDLADIAGMRSESLCRLFKRHLGTTFTEHLNEIRLHAAARTLVASDRLVVDIAMSVGFQNLSYFNRRFKRRFGVTPLAYRRMRRDAADPELIA